MGACFGSQQRQGSIDHEGREHAQYNRTSYAKPKRYLSRSTRGTSSYCHLMSFTWRSLADLQTPEERDLELEKGLEHDYHGA